MTPLDDNTPGRPRLDGWQVAFLALGVFAVVAVGLTLPGLVIVSQLLGPKVAPLPFESAGWRAAPRDDGTHNAVRLRMADSFLADQRPVGKSRREIVALLGEPDDTPFFPQYDMAYYLGPARSPMPIDSEWLVFTLADGVVTEAKLVTD